MTMKKLNLFIVIVFISCCWFACETKQDRPALVDSLALELDARRIMLPNGWSLSPAGKAIPLGDFPMNLVVSPSGKFLAVTNNGQSKQTIQLIDPATESILDEVEISKSWYGLEFNTDDSRLYASGGNDNIIVIYNTNQSRLEKIDSIVIGKPWPVKISLTGIALDDAGGKLFVATKENNSLYTVDLRTKAFKRLELGHEAYACRLSPDRRQLYVSLWGGDKIAVVDTEKGSIAATIDVGSNPNEMLLTKDGRYLYVAQGNDNQVSVIETASRKVIEVFATALYPNSLAGSTPNALALSDDEKKLYIANADNNCVAVFDIEEPGDGRGLGFIPTDWYPTSVKVLKGKVWVTNGKGGKSMANPKGPNPYIEPKRRNRIHWWIIQRYVEHRNRTGLRHIGYIFAGSL